MTNETSFAFQNLSPYSEYELSVAAKTVEKGAVKKFSFNTKQLSTRIIYRQLAQ